VATVDFEAVPTAQLLVEVERADGGAGGAFVGVSQDLGCGRPYRHTSVFPDLDDTARFGNVAVGPAFVHVRWSAREIAGWRKVLTLGHGETVKLSAPAKPGGFIEGRGRVPLPPLDPMSVWAWRGVPAEADTLEVRWEEGGSPYGEAPGFVKLRREHGTGRWRGEESLAPGRYEVAIRPVVPWGRPNTDETREASFEIRAGETTVIELE
jgi:hypothetical protein